MNIKSYDFKEFSDMSMSTRIVITEPKLYKPIVWITCGVIDIDRLSDHAVFAGVKQVSCCFNYNIAPKYNANRIMIFYVGGLQLQFMSGGQSYFAGTISNIKDIMFPVKDFVVNDEWNLAPNMEEQNQLNGCSIEIITGPNKEKLK